MQFSNTKTVREIALEMPASTRVFEEFKIDYCCGGRRPFDEACRAAGADPAIVSERIDVVLGAASDRNPDRFTSMSLSELIRHILDEHHTFTRDEIAALRPLAAKVAMRHGENHPELVRLRDLFDELSEDLLQHLLKEENVLFPYVEQLGRAATNNAPLPFSCFGSVNNPVRMMMTEHDTAGDILRTMRALTLNYTLPEGACPSYTALFSRLEAFERDLHQHIHLENNLLFPKAIELESEVIWS